MKHLQDKKIEASRFSKNLPGIILTIFLFPGIASAVTYEYDSLNRLTQTAHENGTVEIYTYDAAGNILVINSGIDSDGDSVFDRDDNCKNIFNAGQSDNDSDGSGDVCDEDDDNDKVFDIVDNCPLLGNTDQSDLDGDGDGDACDNDDDADSVLDTADNCPLIANADQADADADGVGNMCDDTPNPPASSSGGGGGLFAISLPGLLAYISIFAVFRRFLNKS